MRLLILASLALAGCFSPIVGDGDLLCGNGAVKCPPGYGCACDRCWLDPSAHATCGETVDAAPGPADGPLAADGPPGAEADAPGMSMADAPICGDGMCQYWAGEDCESCEPDCGLCKDCTLGLCVPLLGDNCINCPKGCGKCVCDGICDVAGDCATCPGTRDCPDGCVL